MTDAAATPALAKGASAKIAAAAEDVAAAGAGAIPAASKRWLGPAVIGGAVVLGATLGKFAIAPLLAPAKVTEAAPEAAAAEAGPVFQVRVDNIVVNPLGSQGSRFVMATVVFEVANSATEAKLRENESEVRDLVSAVIGSRSLERLTAIGARDSLKISLADSARQMLPPGSSLRVLLPQFVIQ